jgi:regulator of sigma E protease
MSPEKLLLFLVMLSVLVVLHEYGHFLLARRNGVRVDDFALGMGPTLLKWTSKRSGTNYRLNLLPIGGYCAMKGEDGKTTEAEQQRSFRDDGKHDEDNFQAKTPLQRLAIVVAGPIANFIVALVLLFLSAAVFGVADRAPTTRVYQLLPGYPAQQAGLHPGDLITAIDGGRGLFILVEMLRGKPVDPEKEALVHVGGFAALIVVMLAVAYHDIARILAGQAAF